MEILAVFSHFIKDQQNINRKKLKTYYPGIRSAEDTGWFYYGGLCYRGLYSTDGMCQREVKTALR